MINARINIINELVFVAILWPVFLGVRVLPNSYPLLICVLLFPFPKQLSCINRELLGICQYILKIPMESIFIVFETQQVVLLSVYLAGFTPAIQKEPEAEPSKTQLKI